MAELLKGAPVAEAINKRSSEIVESLKAKGIDTTLAILRVGENPADISYEKGAMKRCAGVGVQVKNVLLPIDVDEETFSNAFTYPRRVTPISGNQVNVPMVSSLCFKEEINMIAKGSSTKSAYRIMPTYVRHLRMITFLFFLIIIHPLSLQFKIHNGDSTNQHCNQPAGSCSHT